MMFSDTIGVMLMTHDRYSRFTKRPIGDARRESQTLIALSVDAVNATLERAVASGGCRGGWRRWQGQAARGRHPGVVGGCEEAKHKGTAGVAGQLKEG